MPTENDAPYAYDGLDRIIHEKARLSVMTSLISHPKGLAFNELKKLCRLTDGNLSRHVQVLAEAVSCLFTKAMKATAPTPHAN